MLRNEVGCGEQSSTTGAEVATKPTALMAAGGRHSGGGGGGGVCSWLFRHIHQ